MQTISHSSRAYIVHANGLAGFLVKVNVIDILRNSKKTGLLDEATQWHEIDLDSVAKELSILPD